MLQQQDSHTKPAGEPSRTTDGRTADPALEWHEHPWHGIMPGSLGPLDFSFGLGNNRIARPKGAATGETTDEPAQSQDRLLGTCLSSIAE